MAKTLIGIVTFGNLEFTKLTVQSIKDTTTSDYDMFIVVGKPGDTETIDWLNSETDITYKIHDQNMGFPYSINDIYDYAWKYNNYDYLVIAGNDVIAYPGCVDSIIGLADTSDYECISSFQLDVKDLISRFPQVEDKFSGDNKIFTDFSSKPWDEFKDYNSETNIADMQLYDIQNLCLYKKSVFDKVGYTDVAFFPAYYVDNDYARRISLSDIKCCTLLNSRFFHFWSRTIHQGSGGSNDRYFRNNRSHYRLKWQGDFGFEKTIPNLKIDSRLLEEQIINHWRNA